MQLTKQKCSCCDDTINVLLLDSAHLRLFETEGHSIQLIFSDEELKDLSKKIKARFSTKGFNKL